MCCCLGSCWCGMIRRGIRVKTVVLSPCILSVRFLSARSLFLVIISWPFSNASQAPWLDELTPFAASTFGLHLIRQSINRCASDHLLQVLRNPTPIHVSYVLHLMSLQTWSLLRLPCWLEL